MAEPVGPTKLGKAVGFLFIVACVLAAGYLFRKTLFPTAQQGTVRTVDMSKMQGQNAPAASTQAAQQPKDAVEAKDVGGLTTVKEYKYVPQEKLPPVKGASNYVWDANAKVVQFPINIWIGWLPIVAANHGFAPSDESIFAKKY